ncbi:HAD family hydrolase [Photobacterium indicum]|uniref:Haloacid dehalogenase-like hydrolase n=1 Tax=Photobacterium indicum TaxID=81447 RepID=A0A2T3L9J7_9GAMM|nr:haloacid dehalogenase-like hydrolase [Photobacterium indicum]PSV47652.1 haloacid dehalogenase-like hydrolase [Photobacterium indicum]
MNLFLLDIDGTLVDSDEIDQHCLTLAIEDVLGISTDGNWSQYQKVTDSGIIDEILLKNNISESRSIIHRKVEARYLECIREYLNNNPSEMHEIKGAKKFIDQMQDREDTHIAIATGAWESAAKLKLQAVGIDTSNITFTSSSDAMSRTEIMALAAFRAKQDTGEIFDRRVFFGDGEWNKNATQELGYDFVAVGTGVKHHTQIPNFTHYQSVFSQLSL